MKTLLSERVVRHDTHLNGDKSINCQKVFLLIGIHNILPIWIFEKGKTLQFKHQNGGQGSQMFRYPTNTRGKPTGHQIVAAVARYCI